MELGQNLQRGWPARRRVADDGQILHGPLAQPEQQIGGPGLGRAE
jgi:hypothetical protein